MSRAHDCLRGRIPELTFGAPAPLCDHHGNSGLLSSQCTVIFGLEDTL